MYPDRAMSADDYFEQMRTRRRRRIRLAIRIAAPLLLVAFVIWGPGWMIERAHTSAVACSNADCDEAPNPKTDCTGGKLWLLFPKIVPWKRAAAVKASVAIDRDAADRRLKHATLFAPDAGEQGRAIEALARINADTPEDLPTDVFAAILAQSMVAWRMGAARSTLDTGSAQNNYLSQTIQRGSIDDAFSFVRTPPAIAHEDYAARDLHLRRGALLCLSGAETEGRAAFHEGLRVFVAGKATSPDGAEVWLDKIAYAYNPMRRGIPSMRARAEAARWRGDSKAEAEWLARAAAIEKLLADPRKLALAKLAGL